jgi:hypothetical protein
MTTDQARDPITLLTAARPTDARLAEAWSEHRADAALADLLDRAAAPTSAATNAAAVRLAPRRTRRRILMLGVAAAATAVTALAGSAILAPDSALPKAAAVERLARAAAQAPATVLGEGQFIHLVLDTEQEGRDRYTPQLDLTNESWTDRTGHSWRRDVSRVPALPTAYLRFDPTQLGPDPFWGTEPADYEQWPRDPSELTAFLRSHLHDVPGKTTDGSQPIFETLSDRFVQGMTPPDLNAALIRVIGSLPEVTVTDLRWAGHDAVRLEYRGIYVNAMYFDRATAAYLGETATGMELVVRKREVVDEVPAEVLQRAVHQG